MHSSCASSATPEHEARSGLKKRHFGIDSRRRKNTGIVGAGIDANATRSVHDVRVVVMSVDDTSYADRFVNHAVTMAPEQRSCVLPLQRARGVDARMGQDERAGFTNHWHISQKTQERPHGLQQLPA